VTERNRRDPLVEGEDKSEMPGTSRSREESMTESGDDEFGEQRSGSSGTTPLGGESPDQSSREGPGGVEGERESR
jgi:hypothetical protein